MIEELYWTALTRPPNEEEIAGLEAYMRQASEPRQALEDVTWALLNTKELIFRN
jgi:hypothetical protein